MNEPHDTEHADGKSLRLSRRMDMSAAPDLLAALRARKGRFRLLADEVEVLEFSCIQILLSARKDGRELEIVDPSPDFIRDLEFVGCSIEMLEEREIAR
ncbi:STAS domain-containing protein [Jannaschia aquimarina]|uniref:MlaB-like STAS domain-containing protein n=1 Tax=Jannaschia aquimarina TaxID=935700 RepID=A0A0D1CQA4_9RHOB|nr:STAS domain-containing protein [Jannaschia aquimarina]KIT16952.1 hypothetical protein jaqu_12650 [Jannaschia aquimarina]SNT33514.1 STAS domain-containing protein [Jannaschia aquimarina]